MKRFVKEVLLGGSPRLISRRTTTGPPTSSGPTLQGARAVVLRQSDTGRRVQRIPYERVRVLVEAGR